MHRARVKIGKKDGAKRIAEMLKSIRKAPISKEVFEILDRHNEKTNSR